MDRLDRLTMEMFMNKKSYNRYIEKTDPKKYEETQTYIQNMKKYKDRILSITQRYLEDPDLQITSDMNQMFSEYCKTCVLYFESKKETQGSESEDEDTLFQNMEESYS